MAVCRALHRLLNQREIQTFPFDEAQIPRNGVYVLFERGEEAHGGRRIVRVGTHTGANQLRSRLRQHFLLPNKDRSIFRKNVGRAILNRREDPYLEQWNWDLTPRKNRERYGPLVDMAYQQKVEAEVSAHIQQNLSFTVFAVATKVERLRLEERLIGTVSLCEGCEATEGLLGRHSPVAKIRESGLWQVQGLWKEGADEHELREIKELL